jgi:hypothetical protein
VPGRRTGSLPKSPAAGAVRSVPWTGVYSVTAPLATPCLQAGLNAYGGAIVRIIYPRLWHFTQHSRVRRASTPRRRGGVSRDRRCKPTCKKAPGRDNPRRTSASPSGKVGRSGRAPNGQSQAISVLKKGERAYQMLTAIGGGLVRTEAEFRALLEAAGFRLTAIVPALPSTVDVIEAVPAG